MGEDRVRFSDWALEIRIRAELIYMNRWLSGEWAIDKSSAKTRRIIHYWLTILWITVGTILWFILKDALWFVGFMSLYAIWITHLAGWAAETPVEEEGED